MRLICAVSPRSQQEKTRSHFGSRWDLAQGQGAKVPRPCVEYLLANSWTSCDGVQRLASTADRVDDNVIPKLVVAKSIDENLMQIMSIKQLWAKCQEHVVTNEAAKKQAREVAAKLN